MQKAIRRADARVAGFFALELWHSGFRDYVWKRLFTISAEDCYGLITGEIEALWQGHELVNKGKQEARGRIFVSKAVLLLCECCKCRDADHLQNLVCLPDSDFFVRRKTLTSDFPYTLFEPIGRVYDSQSPHSQCTLETNREEQQYPDKIT